MSNSAFNLERRHNLDWLAVASCPIAARVIMLLVFAALLTLPIPAAHAAGCTAYEPRFPEDGKEGEIQKQIGSYYIMVPASNFLEGDHKVYIDEKCDVQSKEHDVSYVYAGAFAKNGRKAMEICELNMNQTIAEVMRVAGSDFRYTYHYCEVGERKGGKRQRRQHISMIHYEGDAKGALAECRSFYRDAPKHYRPNHVEPREFAKHGWHCYRVWKVSKKYLKRVGA